MELDVCTFQHTRLDRKDRRSVGSGIKPLGFAFYPYQLEAVQPSANPINSLNLSLFNCKMGMILTPHLTDSCKINEMTPLRSLECAFGCS